jgi:CubicO group peptidase (beta-lactamase class C family)
MISTLIALSTSLAAWRWPTISPQYMQTTPLPDSLLLLQSPSLAEPHARLMATIAAFEVDNNNTNTNTTDNSNDIGAVRAFLVDTARAAMSTFGVRSVGLAVVDLVAGNESTLAIALSRDRQTLDASKDLYRIASITKSMTATALLMLVQSGHIKSLNDSVDQYLDPELRYGDDDAAFGGPVTLHHLLTHTAGFAETTMAQLVADNELLPLRTYLIRVRPPRVYAVGVVPAYSNFGFSLLGRVIERVANQSYEAFLRQRLFSPLGMHQSVISPRDPAVDGSSSYWSRLAPEWAADPFNPASNGIEMGTYVFQYVPAGSVLLTVDDMARYARFHLTRGQLPDGTQLLDAALVDTMHSAHQFSPFGLGYGFLRLLIGANTTSVQHDGDMPTASSRLLIMPSQKRAIFISLGKGGVPVRDTMTASYGARFTEGEYAFEPRRDVTEFPADRPLVDGHYTYTRTTHGGCLDFYYRTVTPELELVGNGRTVGVGQPFGASTLNYALLGSTEKYVYSQTEDSSAGLLGFPFLVASPSGVRADGRAQYVTLSDPTAGFFVDPNASYSTRFSLVVLSVAFVAVTMALLMASCCVHQCCAKQPFERDYSAKWRSKRAYHDAAVYCFAPMQFIMFLVVLINYSLTAVQLMTGFASIGAFVFFPYAFAVCAGFGVLFAVGACLFRVWWVDRRVLFAVLQISFVVFAIVWGALGGGYHTQCWNNTVD